MTQAAAARPISTQRRELRLYAPRRFNAVTRERFLRDRRRRYLARLTSSPSDAQAAVILSLARLEWAALAAEAEGGLAALREAREHRRLFQRLLADFERSLTAAREPTLSEIMTRLHAGAEAGPW